jgi:hypothetical protein
VPHNTSPNFRDRVLSRFPLPESTLPGVPFTRIVAMPNPLDIGPVGIAFVTSDVPSIVRGGFSLIKALLRGVADGNALMEGKRSLL